MKPVDEDKNDDHLVGRLAARFPSLPTAHIRHVVDVERRRLESETLRESASPLVERAAIEELRRDADPVRLREDVTAAARHADEGLEVNPVERARLERNQHGGFLLPDPDLGLV